MRRRSTRIEKEQKEEEQNEEERRDDMEEADNPVSPKKPELVSAPVTHTHRGETTQDRGLLPDRVKHEGELEVSH